MRRSWASVPLCVMTLIGAVIIFKDPNFIMETQLIDDSAFLYEWKTAEEDLEFLDYAYCFEGNVRYKILVS